MTPAVMFEGKSELPGVEVQLNFPSSGDDAETANRLIANALRSPEPEGFVLVRAPLVVQRLMQSIYYGTAETAAIHCS